MTTETNDFDLDMSLELNTDLCEGLITEPQPKKTMVEYCERKQARENPFKPLEDTFNALALLVEHKLRHVVLDTKTIKVMGVDMSLYHIEDEDIVFMMINTEHRELSPHVKLTPQGLRELKEYARRVLAQDTQSIPK